MIHVNIRLTLTEPKVLKDIETGILATTSWTVWNWSILEATQHREELNHSKTKKKNPETEIKAFTGFLLHENGNLINYWPAE